MAINKVVYNNRTLIDLTADTVKAENLDRGITAHDKSGNIITGTRVPTWGGLGATTTPVKWGYLKGN